MRKNHKLIKTSVCIEGKLEPVKWFCCDENGGKTLDLPYGEHRQICSLIFSRMYESYEKYLKSSR